MRTILRKSRRILNWFSSSWYSPSYFRSEFLHSQPLPSISFVYFLIFLPSISHSYLPLIETLVDSKSFLNRYDSV
jgi:hypothetical protein